MNRAKSETVANQLVLQLVNAHGQQVLDELQALGATQNESEVVYYRTFMAVMTQVQKRFGRRLLKRDAASYLKSVAATMLAQRRAESVTTEIPEENGEETGHEALAAEVLRPKLDKLLRAGMLEVQAVQRHRGPGWTGYALGVTAVFGIAAVAFGLYHGSTVKVSAAADNEVSKIDASFPAPLGNLPVDVKGQLLTDVNQSLQHLAVTGDAAYYPQLHIAGQHASIDVFKSLFSTGKFSTTGLPYVHFSLSIPQAGVSVRAPKVTQWDFQITKQWGVLVVQWQGQNGNEAVSQIYLFNLTTREHALAATFTPEPGAASSYTIAAGLGRVIVQGILPGSDTTASTGLPVKIYTLQGTNPKSALKKEKVLSTVPGQLVRPTITTDGIVSQGYAGESPSPDTLNATWYLLNWQGGVTEEVGPPLDGRPHWAIQGQSGGVWWVETTPSGKSQHSQLQVLMGSLSDASVSNQPPALSLNGSVNAFHVADGYLEWVQDTQKVPQLVVASLR